MLQSPLEGAIFRDHMGVYDNGGTFLGSFSLRGSYVGAYIFGVPSFRKPLENLPLEPWQIPELSLEGFRSP